MSRTLIGVGPLARTLRDQYRPLFALTPDASGWVKAAQPGEEMLQHLGFEIAFSTTPDPGSSEPVDRVGPEQAASCSRQVVDSGGAGVLYWADADALKAMLDSPDGRRIRPPDSG